jgi:hypothetical protein
MPTNIVFASDASVVVADEPHAVVTKLKEGAVQFEQADDEAGTVHLLNPALILYIERVAAANGASAAAA